MTNIWQNQYNIVNLKNKIKLKKKKRRRRHLAQDAYLTCMIIYVLDSMDLCLSIKCFLSWTQFYASLKLNPIV